MFASTRTSPLPAHLSSAEAAATPAVRLWADELGERWLVTDEQQGPIEVLKFKKAWLEGAEFEARLRLRVDALRDLRHAALTELRSVEWLDGGEGLGLVSAHVPGRRLSEVLAHARGPAFAFEFMRQVTPAIAALQQVRPGFSHGLLTADRILVTRDGRLIVIDTPLSSAVESMRMLPADLREKLGIAVPAAAAPVPLDPRLDVVQLGMLTLSLLVGRRLDPAEFRDGIGALLDEVSQSGVSEARDLRPWLEHALQMTETPFEHALEALEAIRPLGTVLAFRPVAEAATSAPAAVSPEPEPVAMPRTDVAPAIDPGVTRSSVEPPNPTGAEPASNATGLASAAPLDDRPATATPEKPARVRLGMVHWLAIGLTVVASVQAAAIAGLLTSRPTGPVVPSVTVAAPLLLATPRTTAAATGAPDVPSSPAAHLPGEATATPTASGPASPIPVPPPPVPAASASAPAAEATARPKPSGQVGGVKVQLPFEAQVFEAGALVGSTAGPIALAEGDHDLEVVSETVGLRVRQRVTVKPGALATVSPVVPNGRVNINAAPWASVAIDGTPAGDTPLANVSLAVGSHEFIFRHPQLGEQRIVALVRADGVTRVSASFQR